MSEEYTKEDIEKLKAALPKLIVGAKKLAKTWGFYSVAQKIVKDAELKGVEDGEPTKIDYDYKKIGLDIVAALLDEEK